MRPPDISRSFRILLDRAPLFKTARFTNYASSDHSRGTSTTKGPWGHVGMQFSFDVATSQLAYTITSKSWDVPEDQIWDGIANTISGGQNQ